MSVEYKMVSKKLIYKSIDDAINKCSKPKYFSKATRKVMDKFAEETKNWNHEKALYIDNDGNILWEKEGDNNSVNLDMQTAWRLSDPHETVWHPSKGVGYGVLNIEHNHPTMKGFEAFPPVLSSGDTSKLLSYANEGFLFRSITAEGNGKRMSLVRKPNINAETDMTGGEFDYKGYEKASKHLDDATNKYILEYGKKLAEVNNIPMSKLYDALTKKTIKSDYDVSQHILNEIGPFKSFLESGGVIKELDSVGVSLLLEE